MCKSGAIRSGASSAATKIFALLLIVCLVECVSEQRFNSDNKASIERINMWRRQRGGSCTKYGHSCWGAHGKRAYGELVPATDLYLNRILSRMAVNEQMRRENHPVQHNLLDNDIYPLRVVKEIQVPPNMQSNEQDDSILNQNDGMY